MQCRVAMERHYDPAPALRINPTTTLRPQPNESGFQQQRVGLRRGQARVVGQFELGGRPIVAAAAFQAAKPAESRLRAQLPAPQSQTDPLRKRGSLGMDFDCGGQDLVAQSLRSLLVG